jgi:lysozyme
MRPRQKVSRAGIELLKSFEGLRRRAARLADGRWTIGYGHTLSAREGAEVDDEQAELLLMFDVRPIAEAVNELVYTPLTQNQFDALVAFAFNVGVDAFRQSDVLKRVNEGRLTEAACALDLWRRAEVSGDPIVLDALIRRRAAEKALFLTPADGFVATPSPLVRPSVDPGAAQHLPSMVPVEIESPLDGDTAEIRRVPAAEPPPAIVITGADSGPAPEPHLPASAEEAGFYSSAIRGVPEFPRDLGLGEDDDEVEALATTEPGAEAISEGPELESPVEPAVEPVPAPPAPPAAPSFAAVDYFSPPEPEPQPEPAPKPVQEPTPDIPMAEVVEAPAYEAEIRAQSVEAPAEPPVQAAPEPAPAPAPAPEPAPSPARTFAEAAVPAVRIYSGYGPMAAAALGAAGSGAHRPDEPANEGVSTFGPPALPDAATLHEIAPEPAVTADAPAAVEALVLTPPPEDWDPQPESRRPYEPVHAPTAYEPEDDTPLLDDTWSASTAMPARVVRMEEPAPAEQPPAPFNRWLLILLFFIGLAGFAGAVLAFLKGTAGNPGQMTGLAWTLALVGVTCVAVSVYFLLKRLAGDED